MGDLMPRRDHLRRHFGIGFEGVAGNIPGRLDAVARQQIENALGADDAELAARDRRRRQQTLGDFAGDGVKIERQAGDMSGHFSFTTVFISHC
jgi:hypothetical protein